ncbi:hypothetical protein XENOCAPTIV_024776, partial [Xenoophorus captivus]
NDFLFLNPNCCLDEFFSLLSYTFSKIIDFVVALFSKGSLVGGLGSWTSSLRLSPGEKSQEEYLMALSTQYQVEHYEDCYNLLASSPESQLLKQVTRGPWGLPMDPTLRRATDTTAVQLSEMVSLPVLIKHSVTAPLITQNPPSLLPGLLPVDMHKTKHTPQARARSFGGNKASSRDFVFFDIKMVTSLVIDILGSGGIATFPRALAAMLFPVEHMLEELLLSKGSALHGAIGREQSSHVVPSSLLIPTKESLDALHCPIN